MFETIDSGEEPTVKNVTNTANAQYENEILPFVLYRNTRGNIEKVADQINKAFCFGIYDGAAVLMRRLIEILLIICFKEIGEESCIRNVDGSYVPLSQIINEAMASKKLDLSRNAKDYMKPLKDKGDLSAHNPFHICTRRDLELFQPKLRHLVEELLYKASILK